MDSKQLMPPLTRLPLVGCDPWDRRAPFILTLTGTSGSGKGHLASELELRGFTRIISTTTRPPRENEVPGVHYYFVDPRSFATTLCEGGFAELTRHAGHWYGVTREVLAAALARGRPMCLVLDPRGVRRMRVWAEEQGWRIQTLFLNQSRDQLARTLVRRATTYSPQDGQEGTTMTELLRAQTGWLAELRWDAVINTAATSKVAGALASRLIETARPEHQPALGAAQAGRRLLHGVSR